MSTGNSSTTTLSQRGLIHGRKNAGTRRANEACSDGIAATALPQSSAFFQLLAAAFRPTATKPRPALRGRGGNRWEFFGAIHGGIVGTRMNIRQATPSTVAKRFMKRAHCRWE